MHTIVLATQKGGTGKSSLAIGLAVAAMQNGRRGRHNRFARFRLSHDRPLDTLASRSAGQTLRSVG
jgi:Mrp family chromosome partitioning ATPase